MRQNGFFAEVIKTSKIKVDESSHELPPHNGVYRELKVADYFCPDEWSNDGIFISVKEGDPLWFDFRANGDECAILCAVQRINPVTGEPADLDEGLTKDPTQNYLRMPEQQWLDGYAKGGKVYQFVVTKAGIGLAVNEFTLPKHMQDSHAIGFAFFGPKNPKPKPVSVMRSASTWSKSAPVYYSANMLSAKKFGSSGISLCGGMGEGITGGGLEAMGIDDSELCRSADDDIPISCSNVSEGTTVMAGPGAGACEEIEEVETVDILADREADLTDLDKASMGAGGRILQEITTDENTTDYYHEKRSALLTIYFALPEMYDAIMKKGKRQDASKKDKYKTSGHIGGVAVPLIQSEE